MDNPTNNIWVIEYDNEVAPGYYEWWNVTNSDVSFKCNTEAQADWLCRFLNCHESSDVPS